MSTYDLKDLQIQMKKQLPEKRFLHTIGVQYTAASLAMCYGEDISSASVAGLLHDCAKYMPDSKILKECQKLGLIVSEADYKCPQMLHARLGAYYAREKYHVTDQRILSAIECHTTGKPQMNRLEQIIFTADYIEPGRSMLSGLTQVRQMAFRDLDQAVYQILKDTLSYLQAEGIEIASASEVSFQYYKQKLAQ